MSYFQSHWSYLSNSVHAVFRPQDLPVETDNLTVRWEMFPSDITERTSDDQKLYLADPVIPAHSPETCSSQDNGSIVLLFIELLQTRVQVPTLEATAKEKISEKTIQSCSLAPSPETKVLLKCKKKKKVLWNLNHSHLIFSCQQQQNNERIQYLWIPVGGISSSAEQHGAVNWCRSHYTNKQYECIHTVDITGKPLLVWFSVWLYLFSGRVSRVLPTCFGWRTTASWGFSLLKAAGGK